MPRVKIASSIPDSENIDVEIAHLRSLDITSLKSRWHSLFGRRPPSHLPRHLLFRIMAYRVQAGRLGDLDSASRALLDCSSSPEAAGKSAIDPSRPATAIRAGTVLGREWNGKMHRVAVVTDGFAWNGKTYPSLSQVAFAITGTRWNGPKFFGLRDKASKETSA